MNWAPPVLSSSRFYQPLWSGPGVDDITGFYCIEITVFVRLLFCYCQRVEPTQYLEFFFDKKEMSELSNEFGIGLQFSSECDAGAAAVHRVAVRPVAADARLRFRRPQLVQPHLPR